MLAYLYGITRFEEFTVLVAVTLVEPWGRAKWLCRNTKEEGTILSDEDGPISI